MMMKIKTRVLNIYKMLVNVGLCYFLCQRLFVRSEIWSNYEEMFEEN